MTRCIRSLGLVGALGLGSKRQTLRPRPLLGFGIPFAILTLFESVTLALSF